MPDDVFRQLAGAAARGLNRMGLGTDRRRAGRAADGLERFGLFAVHMGSSDEDLAKWEEQLWESQDDLIWERSKEWMQHLLYCAGHHYIAYHKLHRRWIQRRAAPWRIQSRYNVVQKAVNFRVSRLTENKPMVTVQSATTGREDIEKAEYKEILFWYLWNELSLHSKLVRARRWAAKAGTGFLRAGWDPDAGPARPATVLRERFETEQAPAVGEDGEPLIDPQTGRPRLETRKIFAGFDGWYVGKDGEPLAPVEVEEPVPEDPGTTRRVRRPPPDRARLIHDGQAVVDVRSPFHVRFDRYTDDIHESWYIQDAEILPASRIAALWPDALGKLEEARPASEEDREFLRQDGLTPLSGADLQHPTTKGSAHGGADSAQDDGPIDRDYLVRQTAIYPKNDLIRKLWGEKGALLVTVGGVVVHKSALPDYALKECPYIAFPDIPEEGNHYHKSFLRDLIPLQDDINRMRSHIAEAVAIRSRLILWAPKQANVNMRVLGSMPGVMLETRDASMKPEAIELKGNLGGADTFYELSLAAASDIGNMNDASTGRLPSAGLAAKAIYALQYADERSITETSNLQDIALARLARALDSVTRTMYTEVRKISVAGEDRSYLAEYEISPAQLDTDVDYHFVPGSMLSKQKDAVKNEIAQLLSLGLIEPWEARRYLPTAVPDVFKRSFDLQHAHARRALQKILREGKVPAPAPWEDPAVHVAVLEEFMLSARWEALEDSGRAMVMQLWQAYRTMIAHRQQQAQMAQMRAQGAPRGNGGAGGRQVGGAAERAGLTGLAGAQRMARQAEASMGPPEGFGGS